MPSRRGVPELSNREGGPGEDYVFQLAWERLEVLPDELEVVRRAREVWASAEIAALATQFQISSRICNFHIGDRVNDIWGLSPHVCGLSVRKQ